MRIMDLSLLGLGGGGNPDGNPAAFDNARIVFQ